MIRCRLLVSIALFAVADLHADAQILPPGATPTRLTPSVVDGFSLRFTEGPLYDGAGGVLFTDLGPANPPASIGNPSRIFRYDIASGLTSLVDGDSGGANGLYRDANGQVLAAERERRQVTRRSAADVAVVETVLADGYNGAMFNGPNDLVMDAAGGIYFTDPDYDNRHQTQAVYYLDSQGLLTRILSGLNKPNGIVLSPGGDTLYLAVEADKRIMAYDVAPDGLPVNGREFARTDYSITGTFLNPPFGPDGITIDAAGNVFTAVHNQVFAWNPDGVRLFDLSMPTDPFRENPNNVEFGGADGRTLFIAAGRSLYGIELNVPSPALGDFNGDGTVSAADYTVWRNTLGSTTDLSADGNGNKVIDESDYEVWRSRFGTTLGGGGASTSNVVPEPSEVALMCLAAIGGLIYGQRRSHRLVSLRPHGGSAAFTAVLSASAHAGLWPAAAG